MGVVPRNSSIPLVDRILGGTLEAELSARRSNGDSYDSIARWLATEHDISTTSETVRMWCRSLGVERAAQAGNASVQLIAALLVALVILLAAVPLAMSIGALDRDRQNTTADLACEAFPTECQR